MPVPQQPIREHQLINFRREIRKAPKTQFTPISDLDLMIAQGWGETPQYRIPDDWRTRRKDQPATS